MPRDLHPTAWWGWALLTAIAVSFTTNPLLLAVAASSLTLVVLSRRGSAPWARSWHLYVLLGLAIIIGRAVLHVLVGLKWGEHVLLPLPQPQLPAWAAGVQLLGPLRLEGLLAALAEALRLAVMILAIGAANCLANPKKLLAALPNALGDLGAAVVVAINVAPQLSESVHRVRAAQRLRGHHHRGLRAISSVAVPVLQDSLDGSLALAASMEARGYGHRSPVSPNQRRRAGALSLLGLVACTIGLYGLLDGTAPRLLGAPTLLLGVIVGGLGVRASGAGISRTSYRPIAWRWPESLTVLWAALALAAMLWIRQQQPDALLLPLQPLDWPTLPVVGLLGMLSFALPVFTTPPLPQQAEDASTGQSVAAEPSLATLRGAAS